MTRCLQVQEASGQGLLVHNRRANGHGVLLAPALAILGSFLVLALATPVPAQLAEGVDVVFVVNDAAIKDQNLTGVELTVRLPGNDQSLAGGTTDSNGRLTLRLPPAAYQVSFELASYVRLDTEISIHSEGQVVTTSLSRMLEAGTSISEHRIRIILNWGSDEQDHVQDADSHLLCTCARNNPHVSFATQVHEGEGHRTELDVDDIDWGGPETITVVDPIPGRYVYWVHDYENGPGTLSGSDVVVRVIYDDSVLAERRIPERTESRYWRPFAAIEVDAENPEPRVVSFTLSEIEAGLDFEAPDGYEAGDGPGCSVFLVVASGFLTLLVAILVIVKRRR